MIEREEKMKKIIVLVVVFVFLCSNVSFAALKSLSPTNSRETDPANPKSDIAVIEGAFGIPRPDKASSGSTEEPGTDDPVYANAVTAFTESPDANRRRKGAESLGKQKNLAAIEHLVGRVRDKDSSVRAAVAEALGALCKFAVTEEERLAVVSADEREAYDNGDLDVIGLSLAKSDRIAERFNEGINALVGLLGDGEVKVRLTAVTALGELGTNAGIAVEQVRALTQDSNKGVRTAAQRAVENIRLGVDVARKLRGVDVTIFRERPFGPDDSGTGDPEYENLITTLLESPDAEARRNAARDLLASERALIYIIELPRATALKVSDALLTATKPDNEIIGEKAREILGDEYQPDMIERTYSYLAGELCRVVNDRSIQPIRRFKASEACDLLGLIMNSDWIAATFLNLIIRRETTEWFKCRVEGTVDTLTKELTNDNPPRLRVAATEVLGKMGRYADTSVPILIVRAKEDDNASVRTASAKASFAIIEAAVKNIAEMRSATVCAVSENAIKINPQTGIAQDPLAAMLIGIGAIRIPMEDITDETALVEKIIKNTPKENIAAKGATSIFFYSAKDDIVRLRKSYQEGSIIITPLASELLASADSKEALVSVIKNILNALMQTTEREKFDNLIDQLAQAWWA